MKMNQKGKGQDNYQTPRFLYNHLDSIFDFELDAACENINCLAPFGFYHDNGVNALNESWADLRTFCNPPFSNKDAFIKKAHDEVLHGNCPIVVMILPTLSMTTDAWHSYIHGKFFYQFSYSRYSFIDPATDLPQEGNNSGTTVVYFMKPLPRQSEVRRNERR